MTRPALQPDTWFSRDLAVLVEAVRHFDTIDQPLAANTVAENLGWEAETVSAAIRALARGGYVTEARTMARGGGMIMQVSAEAYREAGAWPNAETLADRLLTAMQQAIDQAPAGEAKSRARRAMEAVRSAGRDFIVDVASGVTTGTITI